MDIKFVNNGLDLNSKQKYINENILTKYGEIASQKAINPIPISQSAIFMDLEIEMCLEIFNIWEINKYDADSNYILDNTLLINKEKFIYKILLGKILRLLPAGVTIISIGINSDLAKKFTLALGYAISQLCSKYIELSKNKKEVKVLDIFNKESIEDFMESYLIEYNKNL